MSFLWESERVNSKNGSPTHPQCVHSFNMTRYFFPSYFYQQILQAVNFFHIDVPFSRRAYSWKSFHLMHFLQSSPLGQKKLSKFYTNILKITICMLKPLIHRQTWSGQRNGCAAINSNSESEWISRIENIYLKSRLNYAAYKL